jgi:CBS domain-containing protein
MNTVRQLLQIKGYDIWTIVPDATVFEALHLMAEKDVGALLVMEQDRLVGIISERDYARKVVLMGKSSREVRVKEIMTGDPHVIHPDQTLEEALALMTTKRVRHLPVVEDDKLIGVISMGDVVHEIIYLQRESIKRLEKYMVE